MSTFIKFKFNQNLPSKIRQLRYKSDFSTHLKKCKKKYLAKTMHQVFFYLGISVLKVSINLFRLRRRNQKGCV
jgi:hypothetical protein